MPRNVIQLVSRLQDEIPNISPRTARVKIAEAIHRNQEGHAWTFLLKQTSIQTEAYYNTGTVTATNGSATVTLNSDGSGSAWATSWTTAPSMRRIVIQGRSEPYDVTSITQPAGVWTATLSEPFIGVTNATAKYTLFRDIYPLPGDCDYGRLLVMWDIGLNQKLSFSDPLKLFKRKFAGNGSFGIPVEFCHIGFTSEATPRPQILFGWDAPSKVTSYRLWYFQRPAFPAADTDIPLFPEPYEDLHWLRAAIEYGTSARTPNRNVPVWQQKFDALWVRAKMELDGGAEIDREIRSAFLGGMSASGASPLNPDFQNNWRLTQ